MPTNLLDPLILDTIIYEGPVQTGAGFDWSKLFGKFTLSNFLSFIIPFAVFLFIALIVKLKYDQKQKKINLGI